MELILAFRHFHSHIWEEVPALVRNGLTAAVMAEAIDAVVKVLEAGGGGCFAVDPAEPALLATRKRRAARDFKRLVELSTLPRQAVRVHHAPAAPSDDAART